MKKFLNIFFILSLLIISGKIVYAQSADCKVLLEAISENYEGSCKNGLADGEGIAKGTDIYTGSFKKGLPHGDGTYKWSNGDIYEGNWKNGKRHGKGEFTCKINEKDSIISGNWKDDVFSPIVKQVPAYRVLVRRNVPDVRFIRTSDAENKIEIRFKKMGTNASVGELFIIGENGDQASTFTGFINYETPFKGTIKFKTPSSWNTYMMDVELQFEITQPGSWEIIFNF